MSQQIIDVGAAPNDGEGSPIRVAFQYTNNNFTQLFARAVPTPPTSNIGNTGDVPGMYAWSSEFFYYCYGTYNGNTAIWNQVNRAGIVSNGNSNVVIGSANSNIVINISSVANVATFTPTGLSVTANVRAGNIVVNANLTAANFLYPNGTSIISTYSNLNVANYLPTYSGNLGNTGNGLAYVFSNNYFYGNGQPFVAYGNTDVAAYLPTYTGVLGAAGAGLSTIFAVNYRYPNGVSIINNYSNANVTAYLPTNTANIRANNISTTGIISAVGNIDSQGNISATGNIYTAGLFIGNFQGNVTGNIAVTGSNTQVLFNNNGLVGADGGFTYDADSNTLAVLGVVTAQGNVYGANLVTTGNVTGNYILGNVAFASGVPALYGNSNVADYLTVYTGNIAAGNISTTGDIIANGNITTYSISTTGSGGNITGANVITANNVSVLANVTAGNIVASFVYGNGSQLTGLPDSYTNSNVAAYLPTYTGNLAGGNITVSSNVGAGNVNSSGNISAAGNIITAGFFVGNFVGNISGNLTVPGANTQVLFNNNGNAAAVPGLTYNSASNILSVTGQIRALHFGGEAGNLSNITAGNVVGTVGAATYATEAGSAGTANTVLTADQPNITSVGTLNSLTVTGNVVGGNIVTNGLVTAAGNIIGNYIIGNGSQLTGLPASYGNSDVTALLANLGSNVISSTANITGGNLSGTLVAGTLTTASQPNITSVGTLDSLTVTGNIAGGNLLGTLVAGTLTTAAQPNITSVGTLSTLSVSGNASAGNLSGTLITGTLTTAAQPNITSVGTLGSLTVSGNIVGGNISTAGNIAVAAIVTTGSGGDITGANTIQAVRISTSGNVTVGGLLSSPQLTKASNDPGSVGQICWDANYIYVCTASNTWKRVALTGGY